LPRSKVNPCRGGVKELKAKLMILLIGKAVQVFYLFDLFCQKWGDVTLGELMKKGGKK
jgi:hypothetical protein